MIAFFIKSAIALSVFLVFYYLILEREKMHQFNRFYLLFSIVISLVIPFVSFEIIKEIPVNFSNQISIGQAGIMHQVAEKTDYKLIFLWSLYGFVTLILAIRFGRNVWSIISKSKINPIINFKKSKLVLVDEKILPHTFLNYIFINADDYKNRNIEEELYTHELVHVTQKHTFDILFVEFLKTIFWFNPIFLWYKKAIQLNHEFLADQEIVQTYNNVPFYQNLLLRTGSGHQTIYLASNLNYLVTKKRLIMMTKRTSKNIAFLKKIAIVPVVLVLTAFLCVKTIAQSSKVEMKTDTVKKLSSKMDVVFKDEKKNIILKKDYAELTDEQKRRIPPPPPPPSALKNAPALKEQEGLKVSYDTTGVKQPQFPGGITEFYKFIGKNFKMPAEVSKNKIEGKVFMEFMVEKDGSLSEFKEIKGLGYGLGDEATRVLKLSPKWIPASKDGQPVRVSYSLPISIKSDK